MTNNKLIAEFMGYQVVDSPKVINGENFFEYLDKNGVYTYCESLLRYNDKWDWLMPVVEKIENDGLDPHELIDKSLRKNNQKRWRSIEDLYNVAVYLINIHNKSNKMDNLPPSVQ